MLIYTVVNAVYEIVDYCVDAGGKLGHDGIS